MLKCVEVLLYSKIQKQCYRNGSTCSRIPKLATESSQPESDTPEVVGSSSDEVVPVPTQRPNFFETLLPSEPPVKLSTSSSSTMTSREEPFKPGSQRLQFSRLSHIFSQRKNPASASALTGKGDPSCSALANDPDPLTLKIVQGYSLSLSITHEVKNWAQKLHASS